MVEIHAWMERFLEELKANFAQHVWFVGLQGSYGRGEATETSDIDVVVNGKIYLKLFRLKEVLLLMG